MAPNLVDYDAEVGAFSWERTRSVELDGLPGGRGLNIAHEAVDRHANGAADVVGVVDTAKGAIEMEIWEDATIEEIVAHPGTKVPVGEVLLRLGEPEGGAEAVPEAEPESPEGLEPPPEPAPEIPPQRAPVEPRPPVPPVSSAEVPIRPPAPMSSMVRASPAARKRAHELGIDLTEVQGSGPDGAVVLEDVLATGPSRHGAPTPEAVGQEPETPHPYATPLARRIALRPTWTSSGSIQPSISGSRRTSTPWTS